MKRSMGPSCRMSERVKSRPQATSPMNKPPAKKRRSQSPHVWRKHDGGSSNSTPAICGRSSRNSADARIEGASVGGLFHIRFKPARMSPVGHFTDLADLTNEVRS
jgi:hypothetical protein